MNKILHIITLWLIAMWLLTSCKDDKDTTSEMKYEPIEEEPQMAREAIAVNMIDTRSDISRAITGEELLNRLRPRIKGLFQ